MVNKMGYVMDRIIERSSNWIHFSTTVSEMNEAKLMWQRHFNIPTATGVLECTHIEIPKPGQFGNEYINSKGYASKM